MNMKEFVWEVMKEFASDIVLTYKKFSTEHIVIQ